MKIEFTGRQTEIPNELRRLAERKLLKVVKLLPGITSAHVILTADKHRQIAEVSVHSRHLDLTAVEQSTNPRLSVATAADKLLRQAQRFLGKRRERGRMNSPLRMPPPPAEAAEAPARRVIRSRRFPVKPMTVEEATLEVDGRREGFVVYRDAATERVSVLYRRPDGHLGLIEPEG